MSASEIEIMENQKPSSALVANASNLRSSALAALQSRGEITVVSNFDMTDKRDSIAALVSEAAGELSLWELAPLELEISYVKVRSAEQFNRNTGEIESRLRTTVIDKDKQAYSTNSPVVARVACTLLASVIGTKRFEPPLKVSFDKLSTLGGGQCLTMEADAKSVMECVGNAAK